MKSGQHHPFRRGGRRSLYLCLVALLASVIGIQTGVAGTLDLQAPQSRPQAVPLDEDAEDADTSPDENRPASDSTATEDNAESPGFTAHDRYAPGYRSNGFRSDGFRSDGFRSNGFQPGATPIVRDGTSDETASRTPGAVERPLPPDPGKHYDALRSQKQAGVPAAGR